jgi:ATP-dependent protease ClpP protease subunit
MPGTRHYYFLDSIGQGDWFSYGTTLQDVRYAVEGYAAFDGEMAPDAVLPDEVVFHYPKCYGGDVWEGYGIYNYIRSLAARGVKTTSRVEGLCASIATLTALAADSVLMAETAVWMVHKPSVDAGPFANADDFAKAIVILNMIQDQLVGRYVARSAGKLDAATAHALVNGESYLTADQCLAYGFITGKLEDAPLEAPVEAGMVLNFISPSAFKRPEATMPTLTPTEEQGLFARFANWLKDKPANEAAPTQPTTPPAPVVTNTSAEVTDNETMYFEGDELAVDTPVYSDAELTVAYPDGDYTLADNRTLTVASGIVTVLADAAVEDTATPPVTNAASLEAANARIAELEQQLNVSNRKVTGLQNKLAKVPGSAGNPTPPGAAQNLTGKTGTPKNTGGLMVSLTQPSTPNRK